MKKKASITFLGTGSSPGVPYLGCTCEVCTSTDPRDKRLRTSVFIEIGGTKILIDTPPDLRAQCLRENILEVDAVLFTHTHADHLYGLDDLRAFKWLMHRPIPCYSTRQVYEYIKCAYPYLFNSLPEVGGGKPMLEFSIFDGPFEIDGIKIEPLSLPHGPQMTTTAYLIDDSIAYLIDCSDIPDEVIERVRGVDLAVIDLVQKSDGHQTHLTWNRAREYARKIGAKLSAYIHFGHEIMHARDSKLLDENEILTYDGLKIDLFENSNPLAHEEE